MNAPVPKSEAACFVADGLEHLVQLPLTSAEDLEVWENVCDAFQKELETRFPELELEHHIWHFFSDSDIRLKESGYRDSQHRAVLDYIRRLRS
jgi:hypothetical protein